MLTLKAFEEAVDVVKKVAMETELIYSDYLSGQTGNKVYLKPENLQVTGALVQMSTSRSVRSDTVRSL